MEGAGSGIRKKSIPDPQHWYRFNEKTEGRKYRDTVSLKKNCHSTRRVSLKKNIYNLCYPDKSIFVFCLETIINKVTYSSLFCVGLVELAVWAILAMLQGKYQTITFFILFFIPKKF
jgi:hypothetical protein